MEADAILLQKRTGDFYADVEILLSRYRWRTCLVHLDDVIVFSKSFEDRLKHVQDIPLVLRRDGLSLNLRKCHFFKTSVDYLGLLIRPGKPEDANKNAETVAMRPHPDTVTQLRSFLGMCNEYRRFVPDFLRSAGSLNFLLQKGQPIVLKPFSEEQRAAFDLLK